MNFDDRCGYCHAKQEHTQAEHKEALWFLSLPRIEHTEAGAQTVIADTPPRKVPETPLKARRPQTTAPLPLEMPAIDAQQGRLF